jgi:hypothetical protein
MLNINCFIHTVLVTTDANYGSAWAIPLTSVMRGTILSVQFEIYRIPHSYLLPLICQCPPVFDELSHRSIDFVAYARCTSHNSLVRLRRTVYTLLAVSHQWVWIMFCADRFQKKNIDCILSDSSNYIVHLHYNRLIADVSIRAFSFSYYLVSVIDNRQSFFRKVAFTKVELTDIINYICSS